MTPDKIAKTLGAVASSGIGMAVASADRVDIDLEIGWLAGSQSDQQKDAIGNCASQTSPHCAFWMETRNQILSLSA
jgi:hypothetical protein